MSQIRTLAGLFLFQYGDYFGITVAGYPGLFSSFVFVFFV